MYTIDKYFNDINKLTRSLVIKHNDIAIINNNYSSRKGIKVDVLKPKTWRYFMNLAGLRHPSNSLVKIKTIENNEYMLYNKTNLNKNPFTKNELLKNDEYYNLLIDKYPDDFMFINGCLYPVDIDKAIKAEDGTILNYNRKLVETSELSLIKELNVYVKEFFKRWYIRETCIVEELYLASFLAVLYANIPNKIFNIRLDKIYTNEAHSFHIEHFFRSNYNIWNDIQVLNKPSLYWLYRNMRYLRKHVGKQKSFDIILDKLYDANTIGVGEYLLRVPDSTLSEHVEDLTTSLYDKGEASTITNKLNKSYILNNSEEIPISTVVNMELETTKQSTIVPQEMRNFIQDEENYKLNKQLQDNVKTKVIDISTYNLFLTNGSDIINIALDYWMYSLKHGYFKTILVDEVNNIWEEPVIEYIEPNDKKSYNVTPTVAFLMAIKALLYITKKTNLKLTTTTYTTIINTDKKILDNLEPMFDAKGYITKLINPIKNNLPIRMTKFNSPELFGDYCNYVFKFYEYMWLLDSNCENILVSSNLKLTFDRMRLHGNYTISEKPRTIDQILQRHGIDYEIKEGYDAIKSFFRLVKVFTNLFVDPFEIIRRDLLNFTNILNTLTSYTTHVVVNNSDEVTNSLYYNNLGVYISKTGIVRITGAEMLPFEHKYCNTNAEGNDFSDYGVASYDELFFFLKHCKDINLISYYKDNLLLNRPSLAVYATELNELSDNRCSCLNKFLTGITTSWYPNQDALINTIAKSNDHTDDTHYKYNYYFMFLHQYNRDVNVVALEENLSNQPTLILSKHDIPYKLLYGMELHNVDNLLIEGITSVWHPLTPVHILQKTMINDITDTMVSNILKYYNFITETKSHADMLEGITSVLAFDDFKYIKAMSNEDQDETTLNIIKFNVLFNNYDIKNSHLIKGVTYLLNPLMDNDFNVISKHQNKNEFMFTEFNLDDVYINSNTIYPIITNITHGQPNSLTYPKDMTIKDQYIKAINNDWFFDLYNNQQEIQLTAYDDGNNITPNNTKEDEFEIPEPILNIEIK